MGAINGTIAVGGTTGFAFKDSTGATVTETGVTYNVTSSNATTGFFNGGTFTATAAGTYTIQAAVGGQDLTTSVVVTGQAVGVNLSAASANLVANGSSGDVITATVVDSNGNTVTNFNGTVQLTSTSGSTTGDSTSAYTPYIQLTNSGYVTGGTVSLSSGTYTEAFKVANGVAKITVTTPATGYAALDGNSDTVQLANLVSTNGQSVAANVNYGSATVNYVAQAPVGLSVTPAAASLASNASSNTDALTLAATDANGVAIASNLTSPEYVTLKLSGPGSFTQVTGTNTTPTTTTQVTLTNGTYGGALNVYPIQGQTGTITVTATASGITTGTATVNAVVAGQATGYTLTQKAATLSGADANTINSVALPAGTAYTLYTVQFTDANGNPVAAPSGDTLTISDNNSSLATSGVLEYYSYNGSSIGSNINSSLSGISPQSDGSYTFAVMNTTTGSGPVTITVKDSVLSSSMTGTYTFNTGAVSAVGDASGQQSAISMTPGQTANISFQLTDAAGNPVATGQSVNVWFSTAENGVTINKAQPTSSAPYQVTTDAQGAITVPVVVSSSSTASTFTVNASTGASSQISVTGTITALSNAISSLTLTSSSETLNSNATNIVSTPTTVSATAGSTISSAELGGATNLVGENAIGQVEIGNSDLLKVTTSNSNVVSFSTANGWTASSAGDSATATAAASLMLPTMTAGTAGTATVTITDVSNPSQPSLSFPVTVSNGTPVNTAQVQINGSAIGASNPLSVTANTPVAITVNNVDGGGNVVPVTSAETSQNSDAVFNLTDSNGGSFRATSTGASITSVKIPVGQTSATVYYVNGTSQTITSGISAVVPTVTSTVSGAVYTATNPTGSNASVYGFVYVPSFGTVTVNSANYTGNVTINVFDASRNPVGSSSPVAVSNGTVTGGVYVPLTAAATSGVGNVAFSSYSQGTISANVSSATFSW